MKIIVKSGESEIVYEHESVAVRHVAASCRDNWSSDQDNTVLLRTIASMADKVLMLEGERVEDKGELLS